MKKDKFYNHWIGNPAALLPGITATALVLALPVGLYTADVIDWHKVELSYVAGGIATLFYFFSWFVGGDKEKD